ncbi:MAG: hypothetical protein VX899_22710 [Myxococcota bacterium]|nr:hypothetical protein [Myxococcota bacterium]
MITAILLLSPRTIRRRLGQLRDSGLYPRVPTPFQLSIGVLRMWHRLLFRTETVGFSSEHPVRESWRARALRWRPIRFPFLMLERAIAPWDMSGLLSSPKRVQRHLMGAHHDVEQYVYDLQMLAATPEHLDALQAELDLLLEGRHPRGEWLRDLCVYEGYHEDLARGLARFRAAPPGLHSRDPDVCFFAYLDWCARQPESLQALRAARRAGRFSLPEGLQWTP